MRKDTRVVDVPLMDQLIARSMNSTSRGRTVPVGRNAEYYLRNGKPVLRPKASVFKKGLPDQTQALAACAKELKDLKKEAEERGKKLTREDIYEFMDKCMADRGYGKAGVTGEEERAE